MGVFDVPVDQLINSIAKSLKEEYSIEKPAFTDFVKTGSHREKKPLDDDWFYVRMASILYRLHKDGANGVGSFRTYYGGRKNRGVKPHQFRKASGKVIRSALQSLEKAGLLKKAVKGRELSGKGHSLLVKKAKELYQLSKAKTVNSPVVEEKSVEKTVEVKSEQKVLEKKEAEPVVKQE